MYRPSPVRNPRSKGIKSKNVLQICLLLAVCFWLIFQVKRSHEKKKEFDNTKISLSTSKQSNDEIAKLGRKDLQPKLEKIEEEAETQIEQDEEKIDEGKDEGKEDEIDDNEQEKSEVEEIEEVIDEESQSQTETETETETGDSVEDHEPEEEEDGASTHTHEGREEHYKADDASSAVVTHLSTENTTNEEISNGETFNNNGTHENGPPSSTKIMDSDSTEAVNVTVEGFAPDSSYVKSDELNSSNEVESDEGEGEGEERDDSSSLKKPRVVWCVELHQQFVAAVNQLGIDKAVPKKILDLMNVPGITRENVASHLQKYRLYLRRLSGSHQSGGNTPSFFSTPDAGYGSISTLSDLEIQALAASGQLGQLGQLPGQSLATLQAAALGRSGYPKSPISVPLIDQRNIFSFENPQSRYGQVQNRQGHNGNITRPMNLLHGIPTTMEPKQLVGMQGSFAGLTSQGLIPLTGQSQSQNHVSRQPVLPGQVVSSPGNHVTESTGNRFQLRGNLGIPSYGLVNNGNQIQTRPLQGADLTFDPSLHMNKNMQGGLNVLQHNNYDSGQKIGGNKVIFSTGEGSGTHVVDNSSMLKAEKVNYRSTFCPEEYSQDDLLTAMFTQQQQQEGIGQGENELGLDWYSLDNLPV